MQTTNRTEDVRFNDPEWCFLAEYPLTKLMVDKDNPGETKSDVLARTMSELRIGAELFSEIERKLIQLTMLAMAQFDQGRYAAPTIRLFSHRKAAEEINSRSSTCPQDIMDNPSTPATIEQPDRDTSGGWGYFVVERGEKTPDEGEGRTCFWIDLFLYREGK
jgi:hypothetical protein